MSVQNMWFEVRDLGMRLFRPFTERRLRASLLQHLKTLNPNTISVPPGQEKERDKILFQTICDLEYGWKTYYEVLKTADWTVDGIDGLYSDVERPPRIVAQQATHEVILHTCWNL